jgi:hypothetical protein
MLFEYNYPRLDHDIPNGVPNITSECSNSYLFWSSLSVCRPCLSVGGLRARVHTAPRDRRQDCTTSKREWNGQRHICGCSLMHIVSTELSPISTVSFLHDPLFLEDPDLFHSFLEHSFDVNKLSDIVPLFAHPTPRRLFENDER